MYIQIKRITANLLIAAIAAISAFTASSAPAEAAARTNMFYGADVIANNLLKSDRVHFGSKVASGYIGMQLWHVGNPKGSNRGDAGSMMLFSEHTWRGPGATNVFNADVKRADAQIWVGSDAQKWCKSFYNDNFTTEEKNRMIGYETYSPASNPWAIAVKECYMPASDKVFFVSGDEFWRYVGRQRNYASDIQATDINGNMTGYWTRSPYANSNYEVAAVDGSLWHERVDAASTPLNGGVIPYAARPAFNLKTDALLFVSAIGAKSGSVGSMQSVGTGGEEFKLTFRDLSRRLTIGNVTNNGSTVSIRFSGATTGSNSYVSAIVAKAGKVTYYGRLAQNTASGSVSVPCSIIGAGDSLYLFSEAYNGSTAVDYASEPVYIDIPDPITPSPSPAPVDPKDQSADPAITGMTTDTDAAGSSFAPLKLRSTKQGKTSIKLKWDTVPGASSYMLYGNRCNTKKARYAMAPIASTAGTSYAMPGLKKGTYYKYIVAALDSSGNTLAISKTIHVATKGGKVKNHTSVRVAAAKKSKVSVKAGKAKKLKAKAVGKNVKKHVGLRSESSDPSVAYVKKGKLIGVSPGSCTVYIYAQNGKYKKLKVTVK